MPTIILGEIHIAWKLNNFVLDPPLFNKIRVDIHTVTITC